MKHNKIIPAVSIGVILTVGLTAFAYFTDNRNADNTITPAENILEISEEYIPPVEQNTGDNIYKKEVSVVNYSNAPCYVRVYMDFSGSTIRSRSYLSNDPYQSSDSFYSAERTTDDNTYISHLSTAAPNWTFVPDDDPSVLAGYYYYTLPVQSGETTDPLFTYVKTVNATADEIRQYDISVYAESVQLSDMQGNAYQDYAHAWEDILTS